MNAPALAMDALAGAVAALPRDRLTPQRLAALEHLRAHGLPTTRLEDWKYTDLTPAIEISNRWLAAKREPVLAESVAAKIAEVRTNIDAHWLVIANGIIDGQALADAADDGFDVRLLSAGDAQLGFDAPLADFNTALLRDGLRITVLPGATPRKPIGLLLIDETVADAEVVQARIEIEIGANATASFVEYHLSSGSAGHFSNVVTNLALADHARADYVRLQRRSLDHTQTNRLFVAQARDSILNHCAFDLGGQMIRNDLHIDIAGPGASSVFNGLYLGGSGQHIDNHTRIDHRVGPATSRQEYRGVLTANARCIWNGKAIVHAGADGTDAEQANHNLLLSRGAEIDAKPELEIYADEVKCSHGTTVGQLDETALFYLRSRGIGHDDAVQILTRAFAASIVGKISVDTLNEIIGSMVEGRLGVLIEAGNK
ncbi:MAG: Fe-S cluster assembly protein SufD [Gammaproteobacteria bacterium]|nr:Fe-S cluster assembly protein SufD [Gammaproteobacteria bacterium]